MRVPAARDLVQLAEGPREVPEIRVWCHPRREEPPRGGDDYYRIFPSFQDALEFIKMHPGAERVPLIAFRGYELNLWEMETE